MRRFLNHFFKAGILLGFSGLLFKLHLTGEMAKLINMKYAFLSQFAALVFLFLFFVQLKRCWDSFHPSDDTEECDCGHHHGSGVFSHSHGSHPSAPMWKNAVSFLLILVPLLGGFFLSPSVLDAQMAAKKTGLPLSAKNSSQANPQPPSDLQPVKPEAKPESDGGELEGEKYGETMQGSLSDVYRERIEKMQALPVIDVTDENFAAMSEVLNLFPEKFKGKTIRLKGFIYKDPMLQNGQIVVSRFIITHCVADAGIIGYVSELGSADRLQPDDWIEVTGKLDLIRLQDMDLPLIEVKRWKKIDPPKDPYVYP